MLDEIFANLLYLCETKSHKNSWLCICIIQLFCLEPEVDTDVHCFNEIAIQICYYILFHPFMVIILSNEIKIDLKQIICLHNSSEVVKFLNGI